MLGMERQMLTDEAGNEEIRMIVAILHPDIDGLARHITRRLEQIGL